MRKIGTLPSEQQAKLFEDFLLTEKIGASVDASGDEWSIWVFDEDQVEQAKSELAAFEQDPAAEKYRAATPQAEAIREENIVRAREAVKKRVNVRETWNQPFTSRCPVTSLLIGISVIVFLLLQTDEYASRVREALSICSYQIMGNQLTMTPLKFELIRGEIWRLVTPIFIHFGVLHILFNCIMLYQLGGAIEINRGSLKLAVMAILIAVPSNLAQYLFAGPTFGGLSGVVYGLFGYMWMKSKYDPQSSFYVPPNMVFILMGFFFLCWLGVMGGIANYAHTFGLVTGMAIGIGSTWLREAAKSR